MGITKHYIDESKQNVAEHAEAKKWLAKIEKSLAGLDFCEIVEKELARCSRKWDKRIRPSVTLNGNRLFYLSGSPYILNCDVLWHRDDHMMFFKLEHVMARLQITDMPNDIDRKNWWKGDPFNDVCVSCDEFFSLEGTLSINDFEKKLTWPKDTWDESSNAHLIFDCPSVSSFDGSAYTLCGHVSVEMSSICGASRDWDEFIQSIIGRRHEAGQQAG